MPCALVILALSATCARRLPDTLVLDSTDGVAKPEFVVTLVDPESGLTVWSPLACDPVVACCDDVARVRNEAGPPVECVAPAWRFLRGAISCGELGVVVQRAFAAMPDRPASCTSPPQ